MSQPNVDIIRSFSFQNYVDTEGQRQALGLTDGDQPGGSGGRNRGTFWG